MARVYIPASLRAQAEGARVIHLSGETVRDLILALEARYPLLAGRLRDGDNLRSGLCVAIDSRVSPRGMMEAVPTDCEVHFLPAIGGG